jgi:hypothetical protein
MKTVPINAIGICVENIPTSIQTARSASKVKEIVLRQNVDPDNNLLIVRFSDDTEVIYTLSSELFYNSTCLQYSEDGLQSEAVEFNNDLIDFDEQEPNEMLNFTYTRNDVRSNVDWGNPQSVAWTKSAATQYLKELHPNMVVLD